MSARYGRPWHEDDHDPHLEQALAADATLIDTELAAYLLGVSERRIRQLVDEEVIVNYGGRTKSGRRAAPMRFDVDALSRLAEQNQRRDLTN